MKEVYKSGVMLPPPPPVHSERTYLPLELSDHPLDLPHLLLLLSILLVHEVLMELVEEGLLLV